jgi:hypothetical protein
LSKVEKERVKSIYLIPLWSRNNIIREEKKEKTR